MLFTPPPTFYFFPLFLFFFLFSRKKFDCSFQIQAAPGTNIRRDAPVFLNTRFCRSPGSAPPAGFFYLIFFFIFSFYLSCFPGRKLGKTKTNKERSTEAVPVACLGYCSEQDGKSSAPFFFFYTLWQVRLCLKSLQNSLLDP